MPPKKIATSKRPRTEKIQSDPLWTDRLRYFEARQEQIVHTIREFVEIESPSDDKPAADRMGAFLAGSFEALGGRCASAPLQRFRRQRANRFPRTRRGAEKLKPVLLLGHFDTVYPTRHARHHALPRRPRPPARPRRARHEIRHRAHALRHRRAASLALRACPARSQYFWFPTKKSAATPRAQSLKSWRKNPPPSSCSNPPARVAQ